jgi:hypothetical protein
MASSGNSASSWRMAARTPEISAAVAGQREDLGGLERTMVGGQWMFEA